MYWIEAQQVATSSTEIAGSKARTLARHRLRGLPVPDLVVVPPDAELDSATSLAARLGPGPWMVRSSGADEDRPEGSSAGRYRSEAVIGDDLGELLGAVEGVRRSGGPRRPLPVLVQPRIEADAAGVIFTRHPLRPSEAVLEAAPGATGAVTAGDALVERWSWDRSGATWRGRGRRISLGRVVLAEARQAAAILEMALAIESLEGGARDIEWAWASGAPVLLQDRPVAAGPALSRYFLPERFSTGVSRLGWSLLGPAIGRRAVEDPLAFVGRRLGGPALVLRRGVPHLTLEAATELFRYFPRRITPDEVVRENPALRRIWWRRTLEAFPSVAAVLRTLVREPDWLPPIHRRRWQRFQADLRRALDRPPLAAAWIAAAPIAELPRALDAAVQWTHRLLALHRWSLVHAELIWRLTGKRPLTEPRHATARVFAELEELRARGPDADLSAFLERHGHRAASIDPADPTWAEKPESVAALLALQPRAEPDTEPATSGHHAWIPSIGPIADWRRFALELRENQRNEWHRILARLRAAALRAGEHLRAQGRLASAEDVFRLDADHLLALLAGREIEIDLAPARPRAPLPRPIVNGGPSLLRGLGVSAGRARGAVRRIDRVEDLNGMPAGCILVARAVDPAWTPAFRSAAGLVQELGGLLSHAAILARESGLPAVMSVDHATTALSDGQLVEVDGGAGTVVRLGV